MKVKQLLSKLLFGLTVPQQYVCLSSNILSSPLTIWITEKQSGRALKVDPVFIGYKPVVFALHGDNNFFKADTYCLNFHNSQKFESRARWKGFPVDENSVAQMVVRRLPMEFQALPGVHLFQGEVGKHSFLTQLHQALNAFRDWFAKERSGNVSLPGNLQDMVRIAYCIPRIIGIVSVSKGAQMNLFPTDLHGQLNEQYYISSLRIGGKAEQQVQLHQRTVLAEIESGQYHEAYALGKNHMKDFSSATTFRLASHLSERFQFPLPIGVIRYFELEVLEFLDVGIHRIFLYKIANAVSVGPGKTLSHIHQYYTEWRIRNGMRTDVLLR